jgi:hypothetical protein
VLRVLAEAIGLSDSAVDETGGGRCASRIASESTDPRRDHRRGGSGCRCSATPSWSATPTAGSARASARSIAEYAERRHISTAQAVLVGRYVEEVILAEEGHEMSKALAVGLADAQAHTAPSSGPEVALPEADRAARPVAPRYSK